MTYLVRKSEQGTGWKKTETLDCVVCVCSLVDFFFVWRVFGGAGAVNREGGEVGGTTEESEREVLSEVHFKWRSCTWPWAPSEKGEEGIPLDEFLRQATAAADRLFAVERVTWRWGGGHTAASVREWPCKRCGVCRLSPSPPPLPFERASLQLCAVTSLSLPCRRRPSVKIRASSFLFFISFYSSTSSSSLAPPRINTDGPQKCVHDESSAFTDGEGGRAGERERGTLKVGKRRGRENGATY